MKLNRLDTHSRLEHLREDQAKTIAQGSSDCLRKNPLSLAMQERSSYVYIFGHPRTADDGVTKRMLWQPRLTKPRAEPNSYLFRAKSHTDLLEVIWVLPPKEMWAQYEKGKICESEMVMISIQNYLKYRSELEASDPDDLPDEKVKAIYDEIKSMDKKNLGQQWKFQG